MPQRPNMPGTVQRWPNWSLALPQDIGTMVEAELPRRIAGRWEGRSRFRPEGARYDSPGAQPWGNVRANTSDSPEGARYDSPGCNPGEAVQKVTWQPRRGAL